MHSTRVLSVACILFLVQLARAAGPVGYYRQPVLWGETIIFIAEGDLWKVKSGGGVATRLTSHSGDESWPAVSSDGSTLAFTATYEGPAEIYTMPLSGGLPTRRTYDGISAYVRGWTPDGKIIVATSAQSTYPATQLMLLDISKPNVAATRTMVPLSQAAEGCFENSGKTIYFTRLPFQGSHTKRYKGGTAQNIWSYAEGAAEAKPLTSDYPGTSKNPMWWDGRVYFLSDRDGTMNIWSMAPDGTALRQHTRHAAWDVMSASMWKGKIVYQLGADIHLYEIASNTDRLVPITLDSDLDQMRERWVKRPMDYLSAVHISPDGDRAVLTARGRVFVAPQKQGRFVEVTRKEGVRYRNARFLPDGKSIVAMSDESGEVELWKLPANGIGPLSQLSSDGQVLRWDSLPSPDGKLIAHHDKNNRLFIYDAAKARSTKIDENEVERFDDLVWSANSKFLAYVSLAENEFRTIRIYSVADGKSRAVTTDRYDSYSPAFSPDGKWLYLLSDRNLRSTVESPWGNYQPEPFLDKKTQVFALALQKTTTRSPFTPKDELESQAQSANTTQPTTNPTTVAASRPARRSSEIDFAGIEQRIIELPIPAGNYRDLTVNDKSLFFISRSTSAGTSSLVAVNIASEGTDVRPVAAEIRRYELSQDGRKLLIQKGDGLFIVAAAAAPAELEKGAVNLGAWSLSVVPRQEWREMFLDAWRLERDYFYDRGMHGVNWQSLLDKYRPLVDRVTTRAELSDLIAQMVGELSALHTFVRGGDTRGGDDNVLPGSLGARLVRDEERGGYRIEHIYKSDPDEPGRCSPLRRFGVNVSEGDVIESVNGTSTLSAPDINVLMRNKAGQQMLMHVKPASGAARDVIVTPMALSAASDLRYHEWEYTRRLAVEERSQNKIGYVHMRAMGGGNYTEWAKAFYPVHRRDGLIIDMRHNTGGSIDSWILSRLMRKAWFFWSQRVGPHSTWNMQYAFRGHIVVLCDAYTMSDGEAFTEGIKRLKLGTVIGTRTWGGEIWLSGSNTLVDRGVATAAEMGVYGPEGQWMIEGHGVEPDIVVDNPPHATFKGEDAQLAAAIAHLQKMIKEKPIEKPAPPKYPDKSK